MVHINNEVDFSVAT